MHRRLEDTTRFTKPYRRYVVDQRGSKEYIQLYAKVQQVQQLYLTLPFPPEGEGRNLPGSQQIGKLY